MMERAYAVPPVEDFGPWHAEDGRITRGIGTPAGFFICEGDASNAIAWMEDQGRAQLAAAAPALAKALTAMVERFGHVKCLQVGQALQALKQAGGAQ